MRTRHAGHPAPDGQAGAGQTMQTAADVRRLLAEEMERLAANPDLDPLRKAGALAQLARVALRAIELDALEARVEAVEATLKLRNHHQPSKEER